MPCAPRVAVSLALLSLLAPVLWLAPAARAQGDPQAVDARVEVWFSGAPMGQRVRALVESARKRLWIVAYSLTDVPLLELLQAKAQRPGFDLRILIDGPGFRDLTRSKDTKSRTSAKLLRSLTREKRVSQVTIGRKGGLLHVKMMLIDDRILVAGSQNWSAFDTGWQKNDVIVVHDPSGALIQQARAVFVDIRDRDWAVAGDFAPQRQPIPANARRAKVRLWPLLPESVRDEADETADTADTDEDERYEHPGRKALRAAILRSRRVWVAMFTFTDWTLGELLVQRANAGADVRVLVDRVQYGNLARRKDRYAKELVGYLKALEKAGRMKVFQGSTWHHKLAVLDRQVFTGSANWTRAAWSKNAEILLELTPDKRVLATYAGYFGQQWKATR